VTAKGIRGQFVSTPSSVNAFIRKWEDSQLREQQASQSHFIELCHLIGQEAPTEVDVVGNRFVFERQMMKANGRSGRADVWYKLKFAWEYKGKSKDLDAAYSQLQSYRGDLGNPPLLVVCDFNEYRIYPQWPDMDGKPFVFYNRELGQPKNLNYIRWLFDDPLAFKRERDLELDERSKLTISLARKFADLAQWMRKPNEETGKAVGDSSQVAQFLARLVFVLFAENIGLLPKHEGKPIFSYLVERANSNPSAFAGHLKQLFRAMDGEVGEFLLEPIPYFNGGLFADAEVLDVMQLRTEGVQQLLNDLCAADWSRVNPSIVGTLFERALDDNKRAELGSFYTSEQDIRMVVDPVLMEPLYAEWSEIRSKAEPLLQRYLVLDIPPREKYLLIEELMTLRGHILGRLKIRVLDPACGSGNFLYVCLRALKDLEAIVHKFFEPLGLSFEDVVTPRQIFGIEKDGLAAQLARVVVWIGYLQWRYESTPYLKTKSIGRALFSNEIVIPILKDRELNESEHILNDDAILRYNDRGELVEPVWPDAEVIVGNPPFLGAKKMITEMGEKYVEDLRRLYHGRLPGFTDLVAFWFEKARAQVENGKTQQVGFLATKSIAMGTNLNVMRRIVKTGPIFWAWSDREWILEGAAVRIAMIGFARVFAGTYMLNGMPVKTINADLTDGVDLTDAHKLGTNAHVAFIGVQQNGGFNLKGSVARSMLNDTSEGLDFFDVVKPVVNGLDIVDRSRDVWVIDFSEMSLEEARKYTLPFKYVEEMVKPSRVDLREARTQERWWLHARSRPGMRRALSRLKRFLCTPRVSKYRVFVWLSVNVLPDSAVSVFAREDDYFFGVMHSYVHELWSLRMGTKLGKGDDPRYTPSTTFETFCFPWPLGKESFDHVDVQSIGRAAKRLNDAREAWLNPVEEIGGRASKLRTLTNLYNAVSEFRIEHMADRPYLISESNPASYVAETISGLHDDLDRVVLEAYGWDELFVSLRTPEGDAELLSFLLELNHERGREEQDRLNELMNE
jgi:hypothetical protein